MGVVRPRHQAAQGKCHMQILTSMRGTGFYHPRPERLHAVMHAVMQTWECG